MTLAAWLLAWQGGSFNASAWLPYAILATLVLTSVLASGSAVRPRPLTLVAVAALVGLALWDALSVTWTPLPSQARDEALLAGFYAVVLAVPLLTLRNGRDRLVAVVIVAAGAVAVALAAAISLIASEEPIELFFGGRRLGTPIDYPNGLAATFLVGFWPAVTLAATRSLPVLGRGAAFGGAAALLAGWLMTQSKGGFIALVVSAAVFFAVAPARLRVLVPTIAAAAGPALAYGRLTEPFRADGDLALAEAIRAAGTTTLWITGATTAAGLLYALADRRIEVSPRAHRVAAGATLIAAVATAAAGVVAFDRRVESPRRFAADQWEAWKQPPQEQGSSYLVTVGSNRYDFWRVALDTFEEHPLAGVGAGGFYAVYLQEGESRETPRRAHSAPLDSLSETGLIGFLLLAAAVAPLLLVAFGRLRAEPLAAGIVGGLAYWITHASGDWIWSLPAAGVPFFLLLGIGASGGERPVGARTAAGAAALVLLVGLLAFAPPWLSARLTSRALLGTSGDAAAELRWARRLDPLAVQPLIAESTLASTARMAVPPLRDAVRIAPRSPGLRYLLGRAYLRDGQLADASRELRVASRLAPKDRVIARTLRRAERAV